MMLIPIALKLQAVLAASSGLASLAQLGVVVLAQTTVLLLAGFLAALCVGPKRLALLSLIYRCTLLGMVLIVAVAISPARIPNNSVRPLWNLSLPSPEAVDNYSPRVAARPFVSRAPISTKPSPEIAIAPSQTAPKPTTPIQAAGSGIPASHASDSLAAVCVGIWLSVAATRLLWLLVAGLYAAKLRRSPVIENAMIQLLLQNLSTKLKVSMPRLVSHPQVQVPFLSGILQPTIVLPASYAADFDASALEAVLTHELAHLARRDCWWKHLSSLVGAVLWIQPLTWVLRQKLEQIDELMCDEMVLRGGCSARSYASVLLNLSERLSKRPFEQVAGAGMVAFRSALGQRIQRIIENPHRDGFSLSSTARLITLIATVGCVAAVLTLLRVEVEAAPQASTNRSITSYNGRLIPQDDTPEKQVGLPATLEEARGNTTITGRVLYENGKPAAGLKVWAYNRWLSQTELWGYHRNQKNHYRWPDKISKLLSSTARTDAHGRYRFIGLLPQRYGIHLSSDHFGNRAPVGLLAPLRGVGVETLANQSRQAPDTILRRSAQIHIRVLDQDTGTPLEGIMLRGFIVDESPTNSPKNMYVDAHRKMRPFRGDDSAGATDKSGNCILSFDTGKAYFYVYGGTMWGSWPENPKGSSPSRFFRTSFITKQGRYSSEATAKVISPRGTWTTWKGETEVQIKRAESTNFTVRLKKVGPLTEQDKSIMKLFAQTGWWIAGKLKRNTKASR